MQNTTEKKHISTPEKAVQTAGTQYRIDPIELLQEIKIAIDDVFDATVSEAGNALEFRFANGQVFRLALGEVA